MVAALYWFDATYENQRFAYVYAVAVKKTHRGKGICTAMMEDTHTHLKLRGYEGILLMPQNDDLRTMYDKLGYSECTRLNRFTCEAGGEAARLHRIDRDEYAALRRQFLPENGALQEDENIAYLEMMAFFYAGEDFLLAAHKNGKQLYCPELLGNATATQVKHNNIRLSDGKVITQNGRQDASKGVTWGIFRVKATGKVQTTRPLSAYQRRVIHLALQNDPEVQTRSSGEGALKHVVILKRKD